ncbi:MAG: Maf family nucleotide pyrophosphatase [Pseudomonadota bacterium]
MSKKGVETASPTVVLASGSSYRRELLTRLQIPFDTLSPDVDETPMPNEQPPALAARLACAKADTAREHLAEAQPALVIGSDQVAECEGRILGKPGTRERAFEQLQHSAGRVVTYHTAVCVLGPQAGALQQHIDVTRVVLRPLDPREIEAYLDHEHALDCAGALKSEGLGITLMSTFHSNDPTALVGLPMIWLSTTLRSLGVAIPAATQGAQQR